MEDAHHIRGRIEFFYRKQKELEETRMKLIDDLRAKCVHERVLLVHCPHLSKIYVCLDCNIEVKSFSAEPRASVMLADLRQYQDPLLQPFIGIRIEEG